MVLELCGKLEDESGSNGSGAGNAHRWVVFNDIVDVFVANLDDLAPTEPIVEADVVLRPVLSPEGGVGSVVNHIAVAELKILDEVFQARWTNRNLPEACRNGVVECIGGGVAGGIEGIEIALFVDGFHIVLTLQVECEHPYFFVVAQVERIHH